MLWAGQEGIVVKFRAGARDFLALGQEAKWLECEVHHLTPSSAKLMSAQC